MQGELAGKVALVTGGSSGIGRATAIKMGEAGAKVVVAARREPEGLETVQAVEASGGEATFVRADVSLEDDIIRMTRATVETYGRIDCAFNNAGKGDGTPLQFHEKDVAVFDEVNALNLRGYWLCMKYQLEQMVEQGSGSIVNNSSIAGITAGPQEIYSATKHGVIGLTRNAAMRYGQHGIRVNAICPGPIETPIIAGVPDEVKARTGWHIPLGRIGEADEVAEAVVFLSSDRASFITGTALAIDGGMTEAVAYRVGQKPD